MPQVHVPSQAPSFSYCPASAERSWTRVHNTVPRKHKNPDSVCTQAWRIILEGQKCLNKGSRCWGCRLFLQVLCLYFPRALCHRYPWMSLRCLFDPCQMRCAWFTRTNALGLNLLLQPRLAELCLISATSRSPVLLCIRMTQSSLKRPCATSNLLEFHVFLHMTTRHAL